MRPFRGSMRRRSPESDESLAIGDTAVTASIMPAGSPGPNRRQGREPFTRDRSMAADAQNRAAVVVALDLNDVRKNWDWFVVLGIVQIVVGTLAVGFAFSSTLASV